MVLHKEGVSPHLFNILKEIMAEPMFCCFRLVGGTNLALRFNHRISTDIDLFTDVEYGSLDFSQFENWLKQKYPYYECTDTSEIIVMGRTYYIGGNKENAIKLDMMYENDKFLFEQETKDGINFASIEEIAVMKMDAIFYGGRKKDFWDLHYIIFDLNISLDSLLDLHAKRFEYQHDRMELIERLTDFTDADNEPDPRCKLNKNWNIIKLDIIDAVQLLSS